MKKIGLIALILALAMVFSGCQSILNAALSNLTGMDWEATTLSFPEMTYTRPDMDEIQTLLDDACNTAATATDTNMVLGKVQAFFTAFDSFETMYYLANIHYSKDLTDTYYQEEFDFCASQLSYMNSALETLFAELALSPMADKLEEDYFGEGYFADYQPPEGSDEDWEYESVWNDEFMALNDREMALINEFYAVQEELSDLDPEADDYNSRYMEKAGPILVDLISLRQEIAVYSGFATYEEYANYWYYNRSDSAAYIADYAEQIKTHLVPLYRQYCVNDQWDWVTDTTATEDDCLNYLRSAVTNMGYTVEEAYEEMIARELYDISPSKNKAAGSYEIYLTTFAAPYILVNPAGNMTDLLTLTHEFGHFANDYAAMGTYASSDVAEVLSQGMEYLSLCYADSLSTEEMDKLRQMSMMTALATYVEQMAYYTFEQRAYALTGEELTVENLCKLYDEVEQEFGFEAVGWDSAEWATIHHLYQSPFYVYGYVVSCDAAMQIYQFELSETGAGAELFEEFLYEWEDLPLSDYLTAYGLAEPAADGRVESLVETFKTALE